MLKKIIFLVFLTSSFSTRAVVTDEMKRFHKCYGLFVRKALSQNHPLWLAVSSGSKSGTDACMEILNKATFDKDTGLMKPIDPEAEIPAYDEEGKRVLRAFSDMHLTFFTNNHISALLSNDDNDNTSDVIDSMGAAHYFTRAVFHPDSNFSEVMTANYSLLAKRSGTVQRKYSIIPKKKSNDKDSLDFILKFWQGTQFLQNNIPVNPATYTSPTTGQPLPNPEAFGYLFYPTLVETGELLGFVPDTVPVTITHKVTHSKMAPLFDAQNQNVKQHFGAGAIGNQAYLLANISDRFYLSDGGLNLYRILGKNIIEDFLCRPAPYVRTSDVLTEVNSASTIDFRKGYSCMSCHAAQDNIAAVMRNLSVSATNNFQYNKFGLRFVVDVRRMKNTPENFELPTSSLPVLESDPDFYKRSPSGKLYYRGYNGQLVDLPVSDIASLGEAISQTEDFYVCSAKKYYKALTGIDVSLPDPGNINSFVLSDEHKLQQQKVINLGLHLKQGQSIKEILRQIIASPDFVNPGKATE